MNIRNAMQGLLVFLILTWIAQASSLHADDLTGSYSWNQMKIGGGGWIVGMNLSSTQKDLVYIRTDVSGAYRWDANTSTWERIVTDKSMPAEDVDYEKYSGVDSIVSSPKDPDVVYMAFNPHGFQKGSGHIYKSTDRGEHWVNTNFADHNVAMAPNGKGRQEGERLAVDPANTDVVYFGSISDGLWVTEDGGANWTKVDPIPAGTPLHGVNTVTFDSGGGVATTKPGLTKTKVIYVTVFEGGIFKTTDAGATWQKISDSGPGSEGKIRDAALGPDRTYYVCADNEKTSGTPAVGYVWKCDVSGKWTNITPPDDDHHNGGSANYWGVAVDHFDGNHVVVIRNGGKLFNSTDQGATWTFHTFHLNSDINWHGHQQNYFLSVGEITFDPFVAGKLWFAEGFGVWTASDFTTDKIEWQDASSGIEEACGNDVIAPPGGQPIAAMWDLGAFYFSDPDSYTAQRSQPYFMDCWGLDWCGSDPTFIAGVFQNKLGVPPHPQSTGFSTDGGRTWTRFAADLSNTLPADLQFGVIAVAAQTGDHIVWCPAGGKLPYYTADRGATWTQSKFPDGVVKTGLASFVQDIKPLCADRVKPDTFYFYIPEDGLFRSTDGGATFAKAANPVAQQYSPHIEAVPGHAGDIWFAGGRHGSGLYHSVDGGDTWTRSAGIKEAYCIGFGKAQGDAGYPTLFVAGIDETAASEIFRSVDAGAKWDLIRHYPLGIDDLIKGIDGDKNVFGVVYLAFNASGFAFGKPEGTATPTAPATPPTTPASPEPASP